jgi:phosphate transport system permease protein
MKIINGFCLLLSIGMLLTGILSLSLNTLDAYATVFFFLLGLSLIVLFLAVRLNNRRNKWTILIFAVFSLVSGGIHLILPAYLFGFHINGIIHSSFISALLLLAVSIPTFYFCLMLFLNNAPRAQDLSYMVLIALPALLVLVVYGLIVFRICSDGVPALNWEIISRPFMDIQWKTMVWQDGWPVWVAHSIIQGGMRNHILGTLMLILFTSLISLPVGIGVGVYVNEYSRGWQANVIRVSTQILRAISVFIIAITAYNLVRYSSGTIFSDIICGFYINAAGNKFHANGSYLTASVFLSLLVIPIIAKATEEGLRSLPRDISEGSLALGASQGHTLARIALPWSIPNIMTGLILGCAEAAGSLSVLLFMGGTGEYGVSPLNGVTSLTFFIFHARYGKELGNQIPALAGEYQISAAFILIVLTVGLTIAALYLNKKIAKRYKGA